MNVKKSSQANSKLLVLLLLPIISFALNISVTILPQKGVIKNIAPNANINVMVPPGNDPATYSPDFKQLKAIKNSNIYFTIGVPFDKKYINKIKEINPKIKIIYFGKYLKTDKNPHIWLSPAFLQLQAKAVLDTLIDINPNKKEIYLKNYKKYITKLASLEKKGFEDINQKAFITFHPSFYYFSKDFHLNEIALQKEGKTPSFRYLAKIINIAKQKNIKTVIISPEFPKKYAKIVANKIGAKVKIISPLNEYPEDTINQLIKALQ